jgi:hypothetical protein
MCQIGDPQPPWLHGGRARRRDLEFSRQIKPINMRPPNVEIIDHELHHKVLSPVLLVIGLKYETAGACPEDRHISVQKFFEAQRLIEILGESKVFCRYERAGEFCSARHFLHLFPPSNPDSSGARDQVNHGSASHTQHLRRARLKHESRFLPQHNSDWVST